MTSRRGKKYTFGSKKWDSSCDVVMPDDSALLHFHPYSLRSRGKNMPSAQPFPTTLQEALEDELSLFFSSESSDSELFDVDSLPSVLAASIVESSVVGDSEDTGSESSLTVFCSPTTSPLKKPQRQEPLQNHRTASSFTHRSKVAFENRVADLDKKMDRQLLLVNNTIEKACKVLMEPLEKLQRNEAQDARDIIHTAVRTIDSAVRRQMQFAFGLYQLQDKINNLGVEVPAYFADFGKTLLKTVDLRCNETLEDNVFGTLAEEQSGNEDITVTDATLPLFPMDPASLWGEFVPPPPPVVAEKPESY